MRRVQSENEKRNMIGLGLRHLLVEVTVPVPIRRNRNFKCLIIQIVTGYIRLFVFTLNFYPQLPTENVNFKSLIMNQVMVCSLSSIC
jgi:hypothetical protein